jgi:hypothetical protein
MSLRSAAVLFACAAGLAGTACAPPCELPPPADAGVLRKALSCRTLGVEPWTLPAGAAADVRLHLDCEGDEGEFATRLTARLQRADGRDAVLTTRASLGVGQHTVTFSLPAGALGLGPQRLAFAASAEPPGTSSSNSNPISSYTNLEFHVDLDDYDVDLPQPSRSAPPVSNVAGHLTGDAMAEQWRDAVPFTPTPPSSTSKLLAVLPEDVNGDDVLDVVVVWRTADTLTVETYPGPKLERTDAQQFTDARFNVGATAKEAIRAVRRSGPRTSGRLSHYWQAVDATAQEMRVAVVNFPMGQPGAVRFFAASDLPPVNELLDTEVVTTPETVDGDVPELLLLLRGEVRGLPAFLTVRTAASTWTLEPRGSFGSLGNVKADQFVLGVGHVGFIRSWKAPTHPRDAVAEDNVFAWAVTPGMPGRDVRVERVFLTGPEAGAALRSVATFPFSPDQRHVEVHTAEWNGDGTPDLIVVTADGTDHPTLRLWEVSPTGELSATAHTVNLIAPIAMDKGLRFFSRADAPGLQGLASTDANPTGHALFVTGLRMRGGGTLFDYKKEIPLLSIVGVAHHPVPGGRRSSLGGLRASGVAHVGSSTNAAGAVSFSFGVVNADDEVLLASHPDGVSVAWSLREGGRYVLRRGAERSFLGRPAVPGSVPTAPVLVQNPDAPGEVFVIFNDDASSGARRWTVWLSSSTGVRGPSVWSLPPSVQHLAPQVVSFGGLTGLRTGTSRLEGLTVPFAEARALVLERTDKAFRDDDLKVLAGVERTLPAGFEARALPVALPRAARLPRKLAGQSVVWGTAPSGAIASLATEGGTGCPLRTVFFPGQPGTAAPVTLSESAGADCAGLQVPVLSADLLGSGGQQVVTASRDGSTWNLQVWAATWSQPNRALVGMSLDSLTSDTPPTISAADVNGDGAAELFVSVDGQPTRVYFSDGLGGFAGASVPGLSDAVRGVPGAGAGGGGGQVACGAGLQCQFGTGTRTSTAQASSKAELL